MSHFQYEDDFELDDDGILRERKKDGGPIPGILLDENGIIQDDSQLPLTPPPTQGDSGIEANRHSQEAKLSDPFYSKPYINDHRGLSLDSHHQDEKSLNISDFDTSIKEELSFGERIGSSRDSSQPPSQANNTQEDVVDEQNGSGSQSQEPDYNWDKNKPRPSFGSLDFNWDKKRISLGSVWTNFDDEYPVPHNTQELVTQEETPEEEVKQPDILSLDVEIPDLPEQGTGFVDRAAERLRVFVKEDQPKNAQTLKPVRESPKRKEKNNNNTKKGMAYNQNGANGYSRDQVDYDSDELDNVQGAEGYDGYYDDGSGAHEVPDQVPEGGGRSSSQGEDMTRQMLRGTMESGFVGSMEMLNTSTEEASHSEQTHTASHEEDDRDADISEDQVTHPLSEISFSHSPFEHGDHGEMTSSDLHLDSDIQAHLDLQLQHDLHDDLDHQGGIEGEEPIPSIYLVGDQGDSDDQYQFKEVDVKSETNTIDMSEHAHDMDDILNEEMPVFTGASIPFTESQEDPISQEKDKTDQPTGDIPHSLIEFEALEVQMRIANQMEKMHEQDEDVFGEFLQKTEQNGSNMTLTDHEDRQSRRSSGGTGTPIFHTGDSLQFGDTIDSSMLNDTGRTGSPGKNSGGNTNPGTGNATPSRIPGLKHGSHSHTPRRTSRNSTPQRSRSTTPTGSRIPSPGPSGARPRKISTGSDVSKIVKKGPLVPANVEKHNYKIRKEQKNEKSRKQPVRPEYQVPNLNLTDNASLDEFSADSDAEKTKENLKTRLRNENHKRSQQGEVIEQLQHNYDRLLTKFALAEVTIDQLRLGAKLNLYSDSPTPIQSSMMSLPAAQSLQTINLASKGQGVLGSRGRIASADFVGGSRPNSQPSYGVSYSNQYTPLSFQDFEEPAQFIGDPADISDMDATTGESLKVGLLFQAKSLGDQIESFQMLLEEDELSVEEQERVFEKIKMDYDKLQQDYHQAKEDSNLMKQHNLVDDESGEPFDNEQLIEGELFRLGMKLDNLHGKVEDNLKLAKRRTPFQDLARPLSQLKRGSRHGSGLNLPDFSSIGRKGRGVDSAASPVMEDIQDEDIMNPKWQKLQKDYGSLLGLYDRLKKLPKTPERDKDVNALMKKLRHLYNQAPDPSILNGLPSPENEGNDAEDSESDLKTSLTKSESTIYPRDTYRSRESLPTHRHDETTPEIEIPTQNLVRGEVLYPPKQNQHHRQHKKSSPENSGPESHSSGNKRLQAKNARQGQESQSFTSFPEGYNANQHQNKLHPQYMRPGDTDSGFIGSEGSRQSAQQQLHKQREQQRLNDPKTKLGSYPEDTVASSIPPYIPRAGPPQQQWTDSELSSAPVDRRTRQPAGRNTKRSMSSLASDGGTRQRTRSSKRGDSPHQRRTTPKHLKESATESETGTARSIKSEKIRQLEETMTQMKAELQRQKQQPVQHQQTQPWQMAQHHYPWSNMYGQTQTVQPEVKENWQPTAYQGYPGYGDQRNVNRPKSFWQEQDPYSEKETQRSSFEESDVTTILEPKERNRPRRRHSFSELEKPSRGRTKEELARPGEQKYIKSESAKRGELRSFHPRERDFDYLKRPKYAADEAVVTKPGRPVRVFASPKDYLRSQERSELDDARNRQISDYLSPKDRQRERQENEFSGRGRQQTDFDRRDASPSRRLPATDNETIDYGYGEQYETNAPEAENHYHYLSDLDHDKERIDRMVFEAQKRVQKQEKKRMEKDKREKKKQPQTTEQVIAPGVVARTLKSPCPACWGEGQQTHTEIQYQSPPQMYGYAPSPVMGQPAYAASPVMGQPAYAASPVMGQPAYAASPVMGQPAPAYIQPQPVTFTQHISPPQPVPAPQVSYIQPAYGAVNMPYGQQFAPAQMTSTPAQHQQPAEEKDTSPILKVPLRIYTSDNNVKYYVREYSDGRSSPTRGRSHEKSSSLRRSSSLPRKPRKKLVPLFTDDESIGLTTDQDHHHYKTDPRLQNSLGEAVKAAAQLQKLSKKMRNDVKNDLKRSIRSNQTWT